MRAILTVEMDGEAFTEDATGELARIFHETAEKMLSCELDVIHQPVQRAKLYDTNGNRVGELRIEEE